jgi:hypothetical protein
MRKLLHKYQQPIWIALTLVIIVSFLVLWNNPIVTHGGLGGSPKVASIYGRTMTMDDLQRDARKFGVARALGMADLIAPLAGGAQTDQEAAQNFIFNSQVFDHEADELQVDATDAEVQQALAEVPGFQTDGKFDGAKLTGFVTNTLPSTGFNDSVIDDLVRQQVRIKKMIALIGATTQVSPAELRNRYAEEHEDMTVQIVRLNKSDLEKTIQVSDADAQKTYNAQKEKYLSPELRKVEVASFELTPDQQKLTGRDRTSALQKLSDTSGDFSQAVVDKTANFDAEAKKAGVPVTTTAFFSTDQPDPAYSKIPDLGTTTFKLTSDLPSSDVIEGQNGYYVLHLAGYTASKPLTFDQAKPGVVAEIQKERADQLMQTQANQVKAQLQAAMKSGKSFADAAKSLGLTAEAPPAFSLETASSSDITDLPALVTPMVALNTGGVSDFIETQTGGAFVYMEKREPVSDSDTEVGVVVESERYQNRKEQGAFMEWLRTRRDAARLQLVQQQPVG